MNKSLEELSELFDEARDISNRLGRSVVIGFVLRIATHSNNTREIYNLLQDFLFEDLNCRNMNADEYKEHMEKFLESRGVKFNATETID